MGFKTRYFISNISDTLVIIVIASMLIPIVTIIKLLLPANNFMIRLDKLIRGRFLLLLINIIYFKVTILVFLGISGFKLETD